MRGTTTRTRSGGFVLLVLGLLSLIGAFAVPAGAEQPADPGNSASAPGQTTGGGANTHPPGNNGVVKVDGVAVDSPGTNDKPGRGHRDNEPHVGCVFNLDWYGFEEGDGASKVAFELWAPTGKGYELVPTTGQTVQVGGDDQGGADDQDGTQQYDLSAALTAADAVYDPNPQQGWHVRVTVETPGLTHGADKKSKMFWIDGCTTGTTTTTTGGSGLTGLVLGQEITTTTTTTVPPTTAPAAAPTTSVPVEVLGVQLARTGSTTRALLVVSGVALLMGGALLVAGKERPESR